MRHRLTTTLLLALLVAANVALWRRSCRSAPPLVDPGDLAISRLAYPIVSVRGVDPQLAARLVDSDAGRLGVRLSAGSEVHLDFLRPRLLSRIVVEPCRSSLPRPAIELRAGGLVPGDGPSWRLRGRRVRRVTLRPTADACLDEITPVYADLPVAVVRGPADRPGDGPYLAELLWSHGIPQAQLLPPQVLEDEVLDRFRAVLVPAADLEEAAVQALLGFCRRGGLLIVLGESTRLAREVGPGRFLDPDPVTLAENWRRFGRGVALVFPEDVPALVRRLRQGDPALAFRDGDGVEGLSASDLFANAAEPARRRAAPAASLIVGTLVDRLQAWIGLPLPRIAPLPGEAPTVLVLTVDQDFAEERLLSSMADRILAYDGEATFYLTSGTRQGPDDAVAATALTAPSPALVERLAAGGIVSSIHPNTWGLPETTEAQALVLGAHVESIRARHHLRPRTLRFHKIAWRGFVETALLLERWGVSMDLDFMTLATERAPALGYMAASATPVRFADERGHLIGVLQQPTQIDDHVLYWRSGRYLRVRPARFERMTLEILEGAAKRGGEPVVANHHPLWFASSPGWLDAVLEWADEREVPVWSAERWLDFSLARRAVRIFRDGEDWVVVAGGSDPIQILVPASTAGRGLTGAFCDGTWLPPGREVYVPDVTYVTFLLPESGCRLRLAY